MVKTEEVKEQEETKEEVKDELTWQPYSQPEFAGLVNKNTGEVITLGEATRRILCYAEEAAKNTR